jgi:DNA replication licensing factor MCM6
MRDGEGSDAEDQMTAQQPQSRKTKITYDKYMHILNLLVRRVNDDESNTGEGVEQEDLIVWYLEQIESELNSEQEMEAERELAVKVLKRMVKVCF